jgi:hypothetical protein
MQSVSISGCLWLLVLVQSVVGWQPSAFRKSQSASCCQLKQRKATKLPSETIEAEAVDPHGIPLSSMVDDASLGSRSKADSDIDDRKVILASLRQLTNKSSDIRGRFVDHDLLNGSTELVAAAIRRDSALSSQNQQPALTPLAAYFIGQAMATQIRQATDAESNNGNDELQRPVTIGIGVDPRPHGQRLAHALACGMESIPRVQAAICQGMATTPACASFCRSNLCDAAVVRTLLIGPVLGTFIMLCLPVNPFLTGRLLRSIDGDGEPFASRSQWLQTLFG